MSGALCALEIEILVAAVPDPDFEHRYTEVIAKSEEAETFDDLVKYLLMVRKQLKDSKVDTELVYAYAKTNQLGPLEEFISGTHFANLQSAGDRCASCCVPRVGRRVWCWST